MAEFEERLFGDFSAERIKELKDEATRSINDFAISFVLGDKSCGSGILVDAFGTLGILTAFHVVAEFERHKDRSLCLIIDRDFHRFELSRDHFEHIQIGRASDADERRGPDISFLKLSAPPEISALKAKKSFYRIRETPLGDFVDWPFDKLFWWIAGAPESRARRGGPPSRPGALKVVHMVAQAEYKTSKVENEFDVITLNIDASNSPFPTDYRGCSGGGVWISALAKDPSIGDQSLGMTWPILAGVVYYQDELAAGHRNILANGPKSLEKLTRFKS